MANAGFLGQDGLGLFYLGASTSAIGFQAGARASASFVGALIGFRADSQAGATFDGTAATAIYFDGFTAIGTAGATFYGGSGTQGTFRADAAANCVFYGLLIPAGGTQPDLSGMVPWPCETGDGGTPTSAAGGLDGGTPGNYVH